MTDRLTREQLCACLRSFFRGRNGQARKGGRGKRREALVSTRERDVRMVRHYIARIRELDRKESSHTEATENTEKNLCELCGL